MVELKGQVTLKKQDGNYTNYIVELLFDMGERSYAMLTNNQESILMRVQGDNILGYATKEEKKEVFSAYNIAIDNSSSDNVDIE